MASESFGLKATGVCLEAYFTHGIPSSLDAVIHDLENQLTENGQQLEKCVSDIMEMSRQLAGDEKVFIDPSEAVSYVIENHLLEKTICYDVDMNSVIEMLQTTIKFIETHPGSEESILHDLLILYSSHGLAFPACASTSDLVSQSVLSLHTAVDQSEQAVESLWNDLCLRLRRYFVDQLCQLPIGQSPAVFSTTRQERLCFIQCLCSIFPTANVLAKYRVLRQQQLQSFFGKTMVKKEKYSDLVKAFVQTSKDLLLMIDEDFHVFNSGIFMDEVDVFRGIGEIYFDIVLDSVSCILESLYLELPVVDKRMEKDPKGMPKSPSDVGFLGRHLKAGLRRQQSQSLESLVGKGDEQQFTDLSLIPEAALLSLVELINCLLFIEYQLEKIQSTSTCQLSGNGLARRISRKKLKSVLKSAPIHSAAEGEEITVQNGRILSNNGKSVAPDEQENFDGYATISGVCPSLHGKLSTEGPQFDWRGVFQRLSPELGFSFRSYIHRQVERLCREESDIFEKTSTLPRCPLPRDLIDCSRDTPKYVSQATWTALDEIGHLIPLALSGNGTGCSSVIGISFLDAIVHSAQILNTWLAKLSRESFDRVPVTCLYTGLSSSVFLLNCLESFEKTLQVTDSSPHKSLASCRDDCSRTIEGFVETIKQWHKNLVMQFISRDALSHNWSDSKEFFEGERCSFDIQMWILTIQQLRFDLWSVSSSDYAKLIFRSVLKDSLSLFAWRYSRIQPSQCRLRQFKADITAILLCTSELFLSACDSLPDFLDHCDGCDDAIAIQNLCNSLLATLAVVAAPLDIIYRLYRKGFDKRSLASEENGNIKAHLSQWLSWIRPALLPLGQATSISSLPTANAIYLNLSIMRRQPKITSQHLLQALLMKDSYIPITILTHLNEKAIAQSTTGQKDDKNNVLGQLVDAFIDIFIKCQQFPDCLAKVILPVIERSNSWTLFDTSTVLAKTAPVPIWLMAVFKQLKPFTNRVIEPGIRLLLNKLTSTPYCTTPLSEFLNNQLPCGCLPLKAPSDNFHSNVKDLVAECLYSMITQLVSDVHSLPLPVIIFFHLAQDELSVKGIFSPLRSFGLKVLATALRLALTDVEEILRMIGCHKVGQNFKDNISMLAECIYHVLTSPNYDRSSGIPRVAGLFMKANKNWLSEQIEAIKEHLSRGVAEWTTAVGLLFDGTCSAKYVEELLLTQCHSILASKTGRHSLSLVQNFLLNNTSWIFSQLDCLTLFRNDPLLSSTLPERNPMVLDAAASTDTPDFNPLEAYTKIDDAVFNQSTLLDANYEWMSLMAADLGLSPLTFRTLLLNRPDIRDCGSLEATNERKMAEALKRKYCKD